MNKRPLREVLDELADWISMGMEPTEDGPWTPQPGLDLCDEMGRIITQISLEMDMLRADLRKEDE